ncbi:hypothetical protein GpartN1_g5853.t1 [Galdieria partita]|uniref:C3H1-type domain-containing protein n=1 Tax=Galdieria partita TaxID=83374 RepID=A0A9C7USV3_9RHOD|nr:hypothetical protein GpartN1_g5853.t1 [Galdieria partita]
MADSFIGGANQQMSSQSLFAETKAAVVSSASVSHEIGDSRNGENIQDVEGEGYLIWERDDKLRESDSSPEASGTTLESKPLETTEPMMMTKAELEKQDLVKGGDRLPPPLTKKGTIALQERGRYPLSRQIEELSKKITYDNYLEVPSSLVADISEVWQGKTLSVLGEELDMFYSKHQWQCVVVTLVLLRNIPLSTEDLKSHKEVARKVYSLSRSSIAGSQEEPWFSRVVHLAKSIVTMWKKTVIEASKQEDIVDLKTQTSKRSRTGNADSEKKRQRTLSKEHENKTELDVPKTQKVSQDPVTLSDDVLFGTSVPNVTISKRNTASKLSSLSAPPLSPGRLQSTEDTLPPVYSSESTNANNTRDFSEQSLKAGVESNTVVFKKRVQFAPPEKLVTIHEIENIEQLRQWEREEAGLSSVDASGQSSSGTEWNETFEAHKKREREMEKSLFQAKSEHFVKAVQEMKEEMEWRSPTLILVEHAVVPGLESVEKTSRERTVQMVPERYSDRNYYSPASPEHKPIELSPLQEIPLESIETSSHASQQLPKHSNMTFKESQAASQQPSVNNVPSQSSFDNNNNVLQMLQQNPSVLQSLLSAFGASMTGNSTFTGAMQAKQSLNYGQQNDNGNDSAVQGIPSTSLTYPGTNLFSSGLSMVNILPSSQSNIDPMLLQQLTQQNQRAVMNQQAFQGPGAPFFAYAQQNKSSFVSSYSDALNHHNPGNVTIGSMDSYGSSQSNVKRSVDDKKTNASKKTNVCYFYNQGTCANGDACRFMHVKVPYKVPHPKSIRK